MLAYCWPIVYDHGSAVKKHWLKVSFLQVTPATQYPDTMLVQCWKSVIDDGTTFNRHWVSASQKEAVTSAERKGETALAKGLIFAGNTGNSIP